MLSRNFVVIAPNIIVLDRLRADFDGLKIFFNDPILPDNGHQGQNWRDDFQLTLHIQDDVRVLRDTGNIFLTNIHRVFLGDVPEPSLDDDDLRDYFLSDAFGAKPSGKTTDTKNCDEIGEYLQKICPELQGAVLTIHTKNNGEISEASSGKNKEELELLRKQSNEIDSWKSPFKAIVSVLMFKEGWDVKNVTTIVGLRAYAAKSNILPEQTLGRGLRRMYFGSDERETVSVMGTPAFMDFVESIQNEGVTFDYVPMGAGATRKDSLIVEVDTENTDKNLADYRSVVAFFARQLLKDLRRVGGYDVLYPKVRDFMRNHLFDASPVNLEDAVVIRNLSEPDVGKILYDSFKAAMNALTISDTGTTRIEDYIRLQNTRSLRTEHRPFLAARKSIFTKIVGEVNAGGFELAFAAFLEAAPDVKAFTKNYLAIGFKFDYVKANGDLFNYVPDFIARDSNGTVWLIETKGRVELDLPQKMARLKQWCADATAAGENGTHYDFVYVDQDGFEKHKPVSFAGLTTSFLEYRP